MGPITLLILNMIFNILYYIIVGIIIFKAINKSTIGNNNNFLFIIPIIYYIAFVVLSYAKDLGVGYGSILLTLKRINCSGKPDHAYVFKNANKFAMKNLLPLSIILLPKFVTDSGLLMAHKTTGLYAFSKVLNLEIGPVNATELFIWGPFKSLFARGDEILSKGSIPKYFQSIQKKMFSEEDDQSGGKRKLSINKILKFTGLKFLIGGDDVDDDIATKIYGDGEENKGIIESGDTIEEGTLSDLLFKGKTYVYASMVTFCLAFFLTLINAVNYFEMLLYIERYGCSMSPTEKIRLHNKIRKRMSECDPTKVKASKEVSI